MMDLTPANALTALSLLWNVGLTLVVYLRKPGEDAAKALEELAKELRSEMVRQGERLTEVETHMEHMPTSEELQELKGTVRQIDERTAGQTEAMKGMRTQLERIENFLLRPRG